MMRSVLIAAALLLGACGFNPVHSAGKMSDAPSFRSIKVELVDPDKIADKEGGYHLQQHLYNRIGQNSGPHILRLDVRPGRRPYGLNSNDVATRYDKSLRVDYSLIDSVSGEKLYSDRIRAVTTFGSSRDAYARIAAEQNATEQVARDAADRILTRLAAYYNDPEKYKKIDEARKQRRLEENKARAERLGIELDEDEDEIIDLP